MPCIDASWTNHGAFPAKHAIGQHRLYILATLEAKYHLSDTHTAERSSCTRSRAGPASHAGLSVGIGLTQLVVDFGIYLVKIQCGALAKLKTKISHLSDNYVFPLQRHVPQQVSLVQSSSQYMLLHRRYQGGRTSRYHKYCLCF